uniref:TFIIS N-terminal domain-containing protein n=1 Tax=Macrostomum lignano TaxID=282301 RepID=A0A1I8HD52_9PLAT
SELRSALSFKVDNSPDLISVKYRETTKLLKDLCLRSKAMSHDVIKGSRELVKAFKAIQRSDERRRSSSALSRVRDLAMAPIRCRSSSRSSRQTTTASSETGATGKSAKPAAQEPSMMGKSFALLSLERSPRNRSPKQTTPAAVSEFKSPVPPRRSSSLNSVPPELHRLLQRHQKLQEPPQCQPSGLRKMSDIATKVSEVDSAQTGLYRSTSANMSELDCTGSSAVRDQITMKSSPKQEFADSAAIVEPTGSVQKLRKLQTLPVEAEEAQSRPVQAVVKRRRHRRPRRAHPTFGGGTSRKSATMTVASRRGNFSEESTRYGHRSGLFSDTSSSGSSGGASGDDESSRAQPAKP